MAFLISLARLWVALAIISVVGAVDCNDGHHGPSPAPPQRPLPNARPPAKNRSFTSPEIERHLTALKQRKWKNPELATLLWNCLPNTLDTTVWQSPTDKDPRSFISTGDQASMYLRDSQNQVLPYIRYAKAEPDGIGSLLRGVIKRHVDSVLLEPYANAFDFFETKAAALQCNPGAWKNDKTTKLLPNGTRVDGMQVGIHQRKWEMDSLSSVLKLGRLYYEATGDVRPFDIAWRKAVRSIIQTYRAQQAPLDPTNFTKVNYTFQTRSYEPKDTSAHGIGRNHRWTGMVRTSFLPSDDSPRLPYHIPGNAFLVVELKAVAQQLRNLTQIAGLQALAAEDLSLADQADALAQEVDAAIQEWGVVTHSSGKKIFAMEVDGFGNFFFGDDANIPSLLGLPFVGYVDAANPTYVATRELLLSNRTNPYFYGCDHPADCSILGGIGSEDASGNAGLGRIWPLSLHIRLLTVNGNSAEADTERLAILQSLVESSGGTGLMHESYWYTNSSEYTRFWFAMANSYMGEALLNLVETRPDLLFEDCIDCPVII